MWRSTFSNSSTWKSLAGKSLIFLGKYSVGAKRSSPLNIDGMSYNIFSPVMLSYEAIETEETKLVPFVLPFS